MTRRGWILFASMSVIWGVPYLMIKVAVEGVSVPVLVLARTAISAAILLPLAGKRLAGLRPHWRPLVAFAAVEIIIPWLLLSDAERHLTSSMSGLLIAASPIIAVLVVRLSGDTERPSLTRWIGLAVGFAGVLVLATPELTGAGPWPIVEVLLTAACYATGPVIAARWLKDVASLPMTAACLGFAALVYLPAAIVTWPQAWPATQVLAALTGLALICTALAFIVFFALIREVGAARALVITYINPAIAVAAGVTLLHEPLTVSIVASFVLILGGSVLATARRRMAPSTRDSVDGASTQDAVALSTKDG